MSALWTKEDLWLAAHEELTFSVDQAAKIRADVRARMKAGESLQTTCYTAK